MAAMEDIPILSSVAADDVASAPPSHKERRRGIAGIFFAYKIAGAKADTMAGLAEVKAAADRAIANTCTLGVALSPCTIPAVGKPNFTIAEDEMEIGMGIHGEPGIERTRLKKADEVAAIMAERVIQDLPFKAGDEVALLMNGLGATPPEELFILTNRGPRHPESRWNRGLQEFCRGIRHVHGDGGSLVESASSRRRVQKIAGCAGLFTLPAAMEKAMRGIRLNRTDLISVLIGVAQDMKGHVDELRDLDAVMGDGDLGVTVGMGSDALIAYLAVPDETDLGKMLFKCGVNVNKVNPSTFGTLQASALMGAGKAVLSKTEIGVEELIAMGNGAIDGIKKRGKAEVGDKTILDALVPAVETFQRSFAEKGDVVAALKAAVSAAEAGMVATDHMKAKFGRGSWRPDGTVGKRDGGATAFYYLIASFARHLEELVQNRA